MREALPRADAAPVYHRSICGSPDPEGEGRRGRAGALLLPDNAHRSTFVRIEKAHSSLILEAGVHEASEERADLPPAHARGDCWRSTGAKWSTCAPGFRWAHTRFRFLISSGPLLSIWWQYPFHQRMDGTFILCSGSARRSAPSPPIGADAWLPRALQRSPGGCLECGSQQPARPLRGPVLHLVTVAGDRGAGGD
ncbi:hypothetical protein SAMN02927923_03781 [Microvirga guangxiensis]|uniref:Uncharacterized protein n=1 Tax=Microvirga guangxiensis TaxID=549386 RepID=A0A1G5KZV6_9HYPH|nr:hypothetical protein SAMN02927923_03781 [Microvirga guangxiensis]